MPSSQRQLKVEWIALVLAVLLALLGASWHGLLRDFRPSPEPTGNVDTPPETQPPRRTKDSPHEIAEAGEDVGTREVLIECTVPREALGFEGGVFLRSGPTEHPVGVGAIASGRLDALVHEPAGRLFVTVPDLGDMIMSWSTDNGSPRCSTEMAPVEARTGVHVRLLQWTGKGIAEISGCTCVSSRSNHDLFCVVPVRPCVLNLSVTHAGKTTARSIAITPVEGQDLELEVVLPPWDTWEPITSDAARELRTVVDDLDEAEAAGMEVDWMTPAEREELREEAEAAMSAIGGRPDSRP